jgi:parvulin-like peptidyl-prolyl cis-trans isomerase-like protein
MPTLLRRVAPVALMLCATLATAAPAPKPWKPGQPPPAKPEPRLWHGKPVHYINGVPDTGQFLPDSAVLGRVNDRVFRVRDFREGWFSSFAEVRPKPDSAGRVEFLNSMANKEVLALTALGLNRPFDYADRAQMREHTQRVLSNVAFQRLVADSVHPSEEDIRLVYEQHKSALRLQHIQFTDRALAERVRADLVAGRLPWSAAVKRYSKARDDKGPDGELGWMIRQAFDPITATEVYTLKTGGISSVFQDPTGFQILRIMERRPAAVPPLESVRNQILSEIQPALVATRAERLRAMLRERTGMVYDTANVTWAAGHMGQTAAMQEDAEGQKVLNVTPPVPDFTPADTARVLARWKDGALTLGGFLDLYKAIPVPQRMNVNTYDAFRNAVDGFVLEPYTAELAEQRGLDKDPLALAMIARKREEIMVEHLYADSVESKVFVSEADRRAYYDKHLREFFSFQNVRYAAILRPGRAAAESLQSALEHGAKAEDILRADSLAGHVTGSIQTRREDEHGDYYKLLFEELKPGQVALTPPDRDGNVVVIQLLEHDSGHQLKLEEVESVVDESVQNIKAESLLKAFIARHRKAYSVELHPELVERIRLVDPMLD